MSDLLTSTPVWYREVKVLALKIAGGDEQALGVLSDMIRNNVEAANFVVESKFLATQKMERSGAYLVQIAAQSHEQTARRVLGKPEYLGLRNGIGITTTELIENRWGLTQKRTLLRGFHLFPTEEECEQLGRDEVKAAEEGGTGLFFPRQ